MAHPPPLFRCNSCPPGCAPQLPCSTPRPLEDTIPPTRPPRPPSCSWRASNFKLPANAFLSRIFFFFPPSKRLKKLSLLVTAVKDSLKHYGGSDQLQRLVGTCSGLCPWLGTLPQLKKCGGCPKFPSEDRAPSPDTPDRFSPTDASRAPETSAHNEAHTCEECKSWGSAQGGRSAGTAANPRIKAEAILLIIHSCFSPKSIHNRTVKLKLPLLLQTIVKMIGICPQWRARLLHPQAKSFWKGCMCEKHAFPKHTDNGYS